MFNTNNNINNEMNQSTTSPCLSPQNILFSKFVSYSTQAMNADPQVDLTSSWSEMNGSKASTTTTKLTSSFLFNSKTNEQNSLSNSFKSNQTASELFQLSEPISNFHKINSANHNPLLLSSSLVFTFNEPSRLNSTKSIKKNSIDENKTNQTTFIERSEVIEMNVSSNEQLSHLDNKSLNTNKNLNIFVINSVRAHPYQPTSRIYTNENSDSFISNENISLTTKNESNSYSNTSNNGISNESNANSNNSFDDANNSNKSSKTNQLVFTGRVNSSSSSNAILAHLKSLGPSLRSIFVRPKNCKLIDSATMFKKLSKESLITGATLDDKQQSTSNGNKKSFFSRFYDDEEEYQSLFKKSSPNAKSLLTNPLLNIRPKEMCLDASVDDLFKKCENDFNHPSAFKQNTSTTIAPNKYDDTKQKLMKATSTSSTASSSSFNSNYQQLQAINEKWTCLVCLSKHLLNVNICSVCGSSKPSCSTKLSNNSVISFTKGYSTSTTSSAASLIGSKSSFSSEKHQPLLQNQSNTSLLNQKDTKSTKYNAIKCWTCVHCKYSNDNLKIVCMNCRNLKTNPLINKKLSEKFDSNEMSPQKRKIIENEDDKFENDETNNAKTSKPNDNQNSNDTKCENCRNSSESTLKQTSDDIKSKEPSIFSTSVSDQSAQKEKSQFNTNFTDTTITSEKNEPNSFFKIKPANSESTWDCNTIETKKPDEKPTESLSSLFKASSGSKWTCSTCMVSNDNDKTACACCSTPKPSNNSSNLSTSSKPTLANIYSSFTSQMFPESFNKPKPNGITFGMPVNESTNGSIKFSTNSFLKTPETNTPQTFSFFSNPLAVKPKESQNDSVITTSSSKTADIELKSPEKTNMSTFSFGKPLFSNNPTTSSSSINTLIQATNTSVIKLGEEKNKTNETPTSTTSSNLFKFGTSSITSPIQNQSSITITKIAKNENTINNETNKLLSNASNDASLLMTPFKCGVSSSSILTPSTASTTPNSFQSPVNDQPKQQSQPTSQPSFSLFQSTTIKDVQQTNLFKPVSETSDSNVKPSSSFLSNNTSTGSANFSSFSLTPTPTPTQTTSFPTVSNSTTTIQSSFNTPVPQANKPLETLNSTSASLKQNTSFGFNFSSSHQNLITNTPTSTSTTNNPSEATLNNLLQQPPKTSTFSFGSALTNTANSISFQSPPANIQSNQSSVFSNQTSTVPTFGSNTISNIFNSNNVGTSATATSAFSSPFNTNLGLKFNQTQTNTAPTFGTSTANAFNFQINSAPTNSATTNFTPSIPTSFNFVNTNASTPGGVFQFSGVEDNNRLSDNYTKRPMRKAFRRQR